MGEHEAWDPHVQCSRLPGCNIMDATPANITDYCCGSFSLVRRDLEATLTAGRAAEVLALLTRLRVPEAFESRLEMVCLKKVSLFLHLQGSSLERQLAQLATFWHGEHEQDPGCPSIWRHSARLTDLSDARMQCSGACAATADARTLGKLICSMPRHPEKLPKAFLCELPHSLHAWRTVKQAAVATGLPNLATMEEMHTEPSPSWHRTVQEALEEQQWPPSVTAVVSAVLLCRGADKALRMRDMLLRGRLAMEATVMWAERVLAALDSAPTPEEVARSLARAAPLRTGDDDAEDVREAIAKATLHSDADEDCDGGLGGDRGAEDRGCEEDSVGKVGGGGSAAKPSKALTPEKAAVAAAMKRHRHANLVRGALPVLRVVAGWLRVIEESSERGASSCGAARLFVAADSRGDEPRGAQPAICTPASAESAQLFAAFRAVEGRYRPQMQAAIRTDGWPAHIAERRGVLRDVAPDNKQCTSCKGHFSALWCHRGVCCECEAAVRSQRRCPFNAACSAAWFCPHANRCVVCDAHSCEQCRLERGAAEAVADAAARVAPARIAIDFDRTLATTRSGAKPVFGKHGCDEDLLALLWERRGACLILTRNGHTNAIRDFLAAHGAPPDVEIRHAKKGQPKGELCREGLCEGDVALLVDDSIAELVHPSAAEHPAVHRVLFVRGLL